MDAWAWDPERQLGSGGFGRVYEASGPGSAPLAAKVVPKAPGATREQLIAQDAPASPHVVPILHVEEISDAYVLYMPRAERSLRDEIGTGITAGAAITILTDLAEALATIAPHVVHRDIKPDNVLYLNGRWALCDFGIARYADAATAQDTRKFSLTPPYAAPEQWRYEHATSATDVYAFGVIAYELLAGRRPFDGTVDELREMHIVAVPEVLPGNRKLSWIVSECLSKAPEARPTAANLLDRLRRAGAEAATRGASALAAAQSAVLEARATELAQAEAARTERERRAVLAASCRIGYSAMAEELIEFITDSAPATEAARGRDGSVTLTLGAASLSVSALTETQQAFSPYDVVAYGEIRLQGRGRSRSHSLYFADFATPRSYSWFELGFMSAFGADFENEPRALPPAEGLRAFEYVVGGLQLAYGMVPLDIGDLDAFIDYWADRFGQAANGQFPRLSQLPDGPTNRPPRRS